LRDHPFSGATLAVVVHDFVAAVGSVFAEGDARDGRKVAFGADLSWLSARGLPLFSPYNGRSAARRAPIADARIPLPAPIGAVPL
jgi:hypothetical protein